MSNKRAVLLLGLLALNGIFCGEMTEISSEEIQKICTKDRMTLEDIKTMNDASVTDDKIISLIKSTQSIYVADA